MKNRVRHHNPYTPKRRSYRYPNAADRSYFMEKLLDGATAVAAGTGIVTILLFLMTM